MIVLQERRRATVRRRDPFCQRATVPAPSRPRIASYVGRSGRARRWLSDDARAVLDVGCSTGYGSAGVAVKGPADRTVVGVERDPGALAQARARLPWMTFLEGEAEDLPVCDHCADAVLLLDVLEHLQDPAPAVAEAHRALRPGGELIVSLPHRGALHRLDALNVYAKLAARRPAWPPVEDQMLPASGTHRHFAIEELAELLGARFAIERTTRTGLGLAEPVALIRHVIRAKLGVPRACAALTWMYVLVYLVEDPVPLGRLGYHLTLRARALPEAP